MIAKIIKMQKDLYYVDNQEKIFMAKARGKFRNRKLKPLVGDNVEIDLIDNNNAYITEIKKRRNVLKRPEISNLDQLLVFQTLKNPPSNLYNLDKYLAMCEYKNINAILVLSKVDLYKDFEIEEFKEKYKSTNYKIIELDNTKEDINENILKVLQNKTSALTGASGVGKSSLLNNLLKDKNIEIGEISRKNRRGKNTTRHTELFKISNNTYVFDTPGFESFDSDFIEDERDLKDTFIEFKNIGDCKFKNCNHIKEPGCKVKEAVDSGKISNSRYENYVSLYREIMNRRKNKW
ncbi:MAG: ribosome small subunit-dependent GTPase A [Tissierellia bacterium]|nr:ribosome small subunit-dependent GTPase A [Tissierellia bacterium]